MKRWTLAAEIPSPGSEQVMQIESEHIKLIQSGCFPLNAKRIILNAATGWNQAKGVSHSDVTQQIFQATP